MKPTFRDSTEDQRLYRHYFANHPDVRKIDLHQHDQTKVTEQLMRLSGDAKQTQSWKNQLAASIRNYVDEAHFPDRSKHEALKLSIASRRYNDYKDGETKKYYHYKETGQREEVKKKRKLTEAAFKAKNGMSYTQFRRKRTKIDPKLNLPLSHHIGLDATPLEAEKRAKDLLPHYTGPHALTKKLGEYLKQKNVSQADYDLAMGLRTKTVKESARQLRRTKSAKGAVSSPSSSSTSWPHHSRSAHHNSAPQPGLPPRVFQSSSPQIQHPHPGHILHQDAPSSPHQIRPAPADWRLLTDFLLD